MPYTCNCCGKYVYGRPRGGVKITTLRTPSINGKTIACLECIRKVVKELRIETHIIKKYRFIKTIKK